jgi:uncharacterized protein YdhG (YjbR/CyaY superfamily)
MKKVKPTSVEEYINAAPENARQKLIEIRSMLKEVAPNATETLKWGMPVFVEKRILFSYAAFKSHLNFVPTGPAMEQFRKELENYKTGKDTIQFPYDRPLPNDLIVKIATYRRRDVLENDARWMY